MTRLEAAAYAAEVCAAVSAAVLARRRPGHVRAAIALAILAAVAVLDGPVTAALTPARVEPWEGLQRVLVWIDGALNLATIAATTGLAVSLAVAPERRRRATAIVGAVWLAASVVLAAAYPAPFVRGAGLQRIYLAADLAGLFVSVVALVTWARASIAAKRSPDGASAVAIGLVLLDLAILLTPFSPWRGSVFGASFDGVQLIITLSFATITAVQIGVISWSNTAG